LKNIKKFELGDSKELVLNNQVFTIHDEFAATKTTVTNEKGQTVAVIDYKLFDFSRRKEFVLFHLSKNS
jgi:hypothetical protein